MICRALQKGGTDTAKQISRARGLAVPRAEGQAAIRPQDHAMLQPMFQVQLVPTNGGHFARQGARRPSRPATSSLPSRRSSRSERDRGHEPSDPRHAQPRARHRRRDDRRRCQPRGCRGRAARDHRAERRREDVALQPALRLYRPTAGSIELAGRDITQQPAVPPHAARASAARSRCRASSRC